MKAFIVDRYGDRAPVRLGELPVPEVGPRDVLVRVVAAGVNPLDHKIKEGEFRIPLPYTPPFVLGNDLAGVVERVGPEVTGLAVGDRVYGRPAKERIGTFAEYIAVAAADLAPVPTSVTMVEAGSLPLVALTAWQALVVRADVRPGQRVLVHAGAGGVGATAIQLAKHLGAEVTTTGSAKDAETLRSLGADRVIDYRTEDFTEVLGGPDAVDMVLDPLGPDSVLRSIRVLRPGGIVVGLGGPPDPPFASELGKPFIAPVLAWTSRKVRAAARRRGVRYRFLFMWADGEQLRRITELVDGGEIRPVVDRTFPFAETPEALAYVATGRAKGKVVVVVDDEEAGR